MYHYVYILDSISHPDKSYVGYTTNVNDRLQKHNEGGSKYTSLYKPWKIRTFTAFPEKVKALSFEKYLKSHSGRAFTAKHF